MKKKFNLEISKININESIEYTDLINLSKIADEPFHDANAHVFLKCAILQSKSIKTIITGDGGDEIFGGYERYRSVAKRFDKMKNPEIIILAGIYLSKD